MALTIQALESMGYKPLGLGESLTGIFKRVDVFAIQGITLDAPYLPPVADSINDVPFKMGLGASLNEVCRQLVGDDFVDDEEQWKKENKSSPPFLLLSFGPTNEYVCSATHYKESEGLIETYDSFREAKKELEKQFDAVAPSLLASLSFNFSSSKQLVCFVHQASAVPGKSIDGKRIQDWRLELSVELSVSNRMDDNAIEEKTSLAIKNAKRFDREIASIYYRGSIEKDPLKRFLYFFFCVERLVQHTFSGIEHQKEVSKLLSDHARIAASGEKLLNEHRNSWKDLRNRFIWCAMHKWTHLVDADVNQFEQLKSVRDNISHGKLPEPDRASVTNIECLVLRILGNL